MPCGHTCGACPTKSTCHLHDAIDENGAPTEFDIEDLYAKQPPQQQQEEEEEVADGDDKSAGPAADGSVVVAGSADVVAEDKTTKKGEAEDKA